MFKKLIFATSSLALVSSPGLAADMPLKAPPAAVVAAYNWSGFYVGGNVGGAAVNSYVNGALDPLEPTTSVAQKAAVNQFMSPHLRDGSVMGGIQAGYNWQLGTWLVGVEADIDALHARNTQANAFTVPGFALTGNGSTQSFESNYLATFRGRVGGVINSNFLLYVTGGLAVADYKSVDTVAFAGPATSQTVVSSDTRWGWVVGAGGEYAFAPNWSVKLEYLHADLGKTSSSIPPFTGFVFSDVQFSHHLTEDIGRIGVNYRWGGPIVAKY
ncbi:outer membrane protein [Bradyrhizobium erythrophlei]|uniref:Outer membrane immunogenic protein n=1 Tax=Bradyrhizobium erythrophlei TaxID=1437360 RepID=A0A1M7UKK2_9BRAD|nr:outer membrane beta-barrel protein [Bradyrhizobium erythrophlei]SHN83552.1 outer membrane immunogenic protein [Bradyrhizobium erythrophlei]